jgi:hypothetical protein
MNDLSQNEERKNPLNGMLITGREQGKHHLIFPSLTKKKKCNKIS